MKEILNDCSIDKKGIKSFLFTETQPPFFKVNTYNYSFVNACVISIHLSFNFNFANSSLCLAASSKACNFDFSDSSRARCKWPCNDETKFRKMLLDLMNYEGW